MLRQSAPTHRGVRTERAMIARTIASRPASLARRNTNGAMSTASLEYASASARTSAATPASRPPTHAQQLFKVLLVLHKKGSTGPR